VESLKEHNEESYTVLVQTMTNNSVATLQLQQRKEENQKPMQRQDNIREKGATKKMESSKEQCLLAQSKHNEFIESLKK
jgi:hypothetical protein